MFINIDIFEIDVLLLETMMYIFITTMFIMTDVASLDLTDARKCDQNIDYEYFVLCIPKF